MDYGLGWDEPLNLGPSYLETEDTEESEFELSDSSFTTGINLLTDVGGVYPVVFWGGLLGSLAFF